VSRWFIHTLTITNPGSSVDRYGNTVRDLSAGVEVESVGRLVIHEQKQLETDGDFVVTTGRAYLPLDTDVNTRSTITHEGVAWEVTGVYQRSLPITSGDYTCATVERTNGA